MSSSTITNLQSRPLHGSPPSLRSCSSSRSSAFFLRLSQKSKKSLNLSFSRSTLTPKRALVGQHTRFFVAKKLECAVRTNRRNRHRRRRLRMALFFLGTVLLLGGIAPNVVVFLTSDTWSSWYHYFSCVAAPGALLILLGASDDVRVATAVLACLCLTAAAPFLYLAVLELSDERGPAPLAVAGYASAAIIFLSGAVASGGRHIIFRRSSTPGSVLGPVIPWLHFCVCAVCITAGGMAFPLIVGSLYVAHNKVSAPLVLCAAVVLCCGLAFTKRFLSKVLAILTKLGSTSEELEAAVLAGICSLGKRSIEDLLAMAHSKFCVLPFDKLHKEDFANSTSSAGSVPLSERTIKASLGECDAFISHSWHDSADAKWEALEQWALKFEQENGRPPTIWLDKVRAIP